MTDLAKWAPEELKRIYDMELKSHQDPSSERKAIHSAIYQLGTRFEMKQVWVRLLAKEWIKPDEQKISGLLGNPPHETLEQTLVYGLYDLVSSHCFTYKPMAPQANAKHINNINKKIKQLERLINQGGSSYLENSIVIEHILNSRNKEYGEAMGKKLLDDQLLGLGGLNGGISSLFKFAPVNSIPWESRDRTQKLEWWLHTATELKLTDVLEHYSERLDGYVTRFKDGYSLPNPKLQRGLYTFIGRLLGDDNNKDIHTILCVIVGSELEENRHYKK